MFVSFSGIVTFKNAAEVREAADAVPTERLLVETDSPFLAPVPHRGHRNEPGFVPLVGASIAALKGIDAAELARSSAAAARRAFALDAATDAALTWENRHLREGRPFLVSPQPCAGPLVGAGTMSPKKGGGLRAQSTGGRRLLVGLSSERRDCWGASPASGHWGGAKQRRSRSRRRWSGCCGWTAAPRAALLGT